MDLMPSLLHLAGARPHRDYPSDGENLAEIILGHAKTHPRTLYWRHNAQHQLAAREGDWKYLSIGGNEFLFNLAEDQRERANLSKLYPEVLQRLKDSAKHWAETMLPYGADNYSQKLNGNHYAERY